MQESVEAFLARGGQIEQVDSGIRGVEESLRYCKCGCRGNLTKHQSLNKSDKGKVAAKYSWSKDRSCS